MSAVHRQLIVNHVPGEETRIALLENGRLEEIYTEHESGGFHVGNIYLGRVTNVESAIQAAFVDFGVGRNGFLHVSDVHPMFFPGENANTTEAVGQKTPHRQRPPIQRCLSRGREIMVQVLKEGIGTKGPTLTSYISIPGRFLVMMPNMEQLGVSRKVEDLEQRREMRSILDSLDLPDGFGFIIRTAGLHAGKAELKRDLAYLQRLWKSIESQRGTAKGPSRLYAESDLITRTVRDLASMDLNEIIVDDKPVVDRLQRFMRLVSPRRKGPEISAYLDQMPIFHRYNIETQMRGIHAREVPLPGGGSIVIDSAEAMVVVDVNSGKMRHFRNAESTAYQTNLEAIDEICRQLRLRDLGGIVVIDTIDMISGDHRKQIENRLRDNLKRDRAKTEFLRISNFGLIQMTRQRFRSPLRKEQFSTCPTCEGRGVIQTIEATAIDALRDLTYWATHPQVATIDMVVSSALGNLLISKKRRQIAEIEQSSGKSIEIRVGTEFPAGRIDFYAYDAHRTDLELSVLASTFPAQLERTLTADDEANLDDDHAVLDGDQTDGIAKQENAHDDTPSAGGRRRSRRRRRRGGSAEDSQKTQSMPSTADSEQADAPDQRPVKKSRRRRSKKKTTTAATESKTDSKPTSDPQEQADQPTATKKTKSRRRRSSKKKVESPSDDAERPADTTTAADEAKTDESSQSKPARRRRRSRSRSKAEAAPTLSDGKPGAAPTDAKPDAAASATKDSAGSGKKKKSRRRRRSRSASATDTDGASPGTGDAQKKPSTTDSKVTTGKDGAATDGNSTDAARPRRTLYGNRRKLSPAELAMAQTRNED